MYGMRKIKKAYPDINFSKVKMINGILWPKFEYQFRNKWPRYKRKNDVYKQTWQLNKWSEWDNQSTESYEKGYDYVEQDRV